MKISPEFLNQSTFISPTIISGSGNSVGHIGGLNSSITSSTYHLPIPLPELVLTIINDDCIECVFKQNNHKWPNEGDSVFKVIFSCKEGKWHKSEPIFGLIIPASKEEFYFEDPK